MTNKCGETCEIPNKFVTSWVIKARVWFTCTFVEIRQRLLVKFFLVEKDKREVEELHHHRTKIICLSLTLILFQSILFNLLHYFSYQTFSSHKNYNVHK